MPSRFWIVDMLRALLMIMHDGFYALAQHCAGEIARMMEDDVWRFR